MLRVCGGLMLGTLLVTIAQVFAVNADERAKAAQRKRISDRRHDAFRPATDR